MKLYWIHRENYPEDIWFTAAENAEALLQKYAQEFKRDIDFVRENCVWDEIRVVDGYMVLLKEIK